MIRIAANRIVFKGGHGHKWASSFSPTAVEDFEVNDDCFTSGKPHNRFPLFPLFPPPPSSPPTTSANFTEMIHSKIDQDNSERMGVSSSYFKFAEVAKYYFDGKGKAIRPLLSHLMSESVNNRLGIGIESYGYADLLEKQSDVGLYSEMLHTSSLYHDDILDAADSRRGQESINRKFDENTAVHAGGHACMLANRMVAQIGDKDVLVMMIGVMDSLVAGELQQADKKDNNVHKNCSSIITDDDVDMFLGPSAFAFADERTRALCKKYLLKSYNKTASLMANSCKAVVTLACKFQNLNQAEHQAITNASFNFGRDIGICFQIVDDALDFEAEHEVLGKPVAADLKLGLATAPVLLSLRYFPSDLSTLTARRFSKPGDPERALAMVKTARGPEMARMAAKRFSDRAKKGLQEAGLLTEALERMLDKAAQRHM